MTADVRERKRMASARHRARARGENAPLRLRLWTPEEVGELREAYASNVGRKTGWLRRVALAMGRDSGNLVRKAKSLGIATDVKRAGRRKSRQSTIWTRLPAVERVRMRAASRTGFWHVSGREHPRGMLGKKHSQEARTKMSVSRLGVPRPVMSQAHRDAISRSRAEMLKRRPELQGASRGKGGRRPDLGGRYFRSKWEANYARYLNFTRVEWEFEPKTFWFETIKRGTRSYTPDFWLPGKRCYHEVKGWMDDKSRVKLERMARFYPEVKIVVIDKEWFAQAERGGLCGVIPHWECKHNETRARLVVSRP